MSLAIEPRMPGSRSPGSRRHVRDCRALNRASSPCHTCARCARCRIGIVNHVDDYSQCLFTISHMDPHWRTTLTPDARRRPHRCCDGGGSRPGARGRRRDDRSHRSTSVPASPSSREHDDRSRSTGHRHADRRRRRADVPQAAAPRLAVADLGRRSPRSIGDTARLNSTGSTNCGCTAARSTTICRPVSDCRRLAGRRPAEPTTIRTRSGSRSGWRWSTTIPTGRSIGTPRSPSRLGAMAGRWPESRVAEQLGFVVGRWPTSSSARS